MSKNPLTKTNAYGLPDFTPAQMEEIKEFESASDEVQKILSDIKYSLGFGVLVTVLCDFIFKNIDGPVKQTVELESFGQEVELLLLKLRESEKYFAKMEREMKR